MRTGCAPRAAADPVTAIAESLALEPGVLITAVEVKLWRMKSKLLGTFRLDTRHGPLR
jgi:hypothetical protein